MIRRPSSRPVVLRTGLILLATFNTLVGVWLLVAPDSFFRNFPGLGMHWVSVFPPYNEHALTDFGGALLGVTAVVWIAALVLERRLVQVALVAQLVQAVPHFVYHLAHLEALPTDEAIASQVTLAMPVVVPLLLLWLTRQEWDRETDPRAEARRADSNSS